MTERKITKPIKLDGSKASNETTSGDMEKDQEIERLEGLLSKQKAVL